MYPATTTQVGNYLDNSNTWYSGQPVNMLYGYYLYLHFTYYVWMITGTPRSLAACNPLTPYFSLVPSLVFPHPTLPYTT